MKRILFAGGVGGLVVFVWAAIAHMVLPLGETDIGWIPNQDAIIALLKEEVQKPGIYMLPSYDMSRDPTEEEVAAWEEKYRAGPRALLIYRPLGAEPMSPGQFLTELASNIAAALVAAFVLSAAAAGFRCYLLSVTLLGLFSWLSLSVSHWNWYGFPADHTIAAGIIEIIGWFLAGLAMAWVATGKNACCEP